MNVCIISGLVDSSSKCVATTAITLWCHMLWCWTIPRGHYLHSWEGAGIWEPSGSFLTRNIENPKNREQHAPDTKISIKQKVCKNTGFHVLHKAVRPITWSLVSWSGAPRIYADLLTNQRIPCQPHFCLLFFERVWHFLSQTEINGKID